MTSPMEAKLKQEIQSSPCLFPFDLSPDGQLVHFVRLTEEDYRLASFMDQRMLAEAAKGGKSYHSGNVSWNLLLPWARELQVRCDFIFHVSHAGSTMLSRILGEHPQCFAVREPWILRSLVDPSASNYLRDFLALWSRTYRPTQRTMIKATSFVSQIGTELMQLANDSKTILMFVPAETFLASVLDGSMSDIDASAKSRLDRFHRNPSMPHVSLAQLSPGERAAMCWLVEMESLKTIHRTFPNRTQFLDFDLFLQEPERHLRNVSQFFGMNGHESSMLTSPFTKRYAKKIEVPYDTDFRSKLLEQSKMKHAEEIVRGLRWIEAID